MSTMKKGDVFGNIGTIANVANIAGNAFGFNPMQMITNKIPKIGGLSSILSQFINNIPS